MSTGIGVVPALIGAAFGIIAIVAEQRGAGTHHRRQRFRIWFPFILHHHFPLFCIANAVFP